jgi:hypothetical protein
MILILFSNFMQVLHNIYKHRTKNEYLPKHILFSTIYLMQEHISNPNKYSEQDIKYKLFCIS